MCTMKYAKKSTIVFRFFYAAITIITFTASKLEVELILKTLIIFFNIEWEIK